MYPVEYIVTIWDDLTNKEEVVKGITFAKNYTEAMSKIEDYYGNEIIDIKMFMLEEGSVYELEYIKDSPIFTEEAIKLNA